ncbi:MAG: hypothetical protein IIC73_05275 [Armatimonadetes bacterium]|nr:hypothetical protein [Armatimonadota bacterium]
MNLSLRGMNWGAASAVVALVGIGIFHFAAPMPGDVPQGAPKSADEARTRAAKEGEDYRAVRDENAARLWQAARDEVSPQAMSWVSARARESFVTVSSFRPQRTNDLDGVNQMNYLVAAEGAYQDVMRFIKAFEAEDSLLAVKLVQITGIDGATDTVRASIGLVAYLEAEDG